MIGTDIELAAPAMFFGQQLAEQLDTARNQFVPRLDSPVNKLQKLTGQPKLDAILRHPVSLSIDDVIRNRDVLVVSGSVGAFGEGSAKVLLQFILHMVHRALIRQQALPEHDRARVALKVDEAHLLFSAHVHAHARDGPLRRARMHRRLAVARPDRGPRPALDRSSTSSATGSSSRSPTTTRAR